MTDEEVRNVAKIFEAFARAVAKRDNIKIEYLNCDGDFENLIIEMNKVLPTFSFDISGFIVVKKNGVCVFNQNVSDIQSVTVFRTTKLKFHEVNKK